MRPIDADALAEVLNEMIAECTEFQCGGFFSNGIRKGLNDAYRAVINFPTLDCEPVRHSQWQLRSFAPRKITVDGTVVCPKCGNHFFRIVGTWFKRCPECGTLMDGKEDGNEAVHT